MRDSLLIDAGITGDGNIEIVVHPAHDDFLAVQHLLTIYPGELLGKEHLFYTKVVVETRLRAPAYMKCRKYVSFGPFHDPAQLIPVLHLLKRELFDGRAGDDKTVEILILYLIYRYIKLIQMGGICMP